MGKFSVGAAMLAMMPLMAPITAGAAGLAPLQPGLWEMQVSGVVQAGPGLQQSFSRIEAAELFLSADAVNQDIVVTGGRFLLQNDIEALRQIDAAVNDAHGAD